MKQSGETVSVIFIRPQVFVDRYMYLSISGISNKPRLHGALEQETWIRN